MSSAVRRLAVLLLAPLARAALLASSLRLEAPAKAATAAIALTNGELPANADEADFWCALHPSSLGSVNAAIAMGSVSTSPAILQQEVGVPTAVGRLRCRDARIDMLRCTLPKEDPMSEEALGLIVDALLQEWLRHCSSSGAAFEALDCTASTQTAAIVSARGFAECEHPDFSALARGESIGTHEARLAASIVSYERRIPMTEDVIDRSMLESILSALRDQGETGVMSKPLAPPKKDPWAGIKGFGQ